MQSTQRTEEEARSLFTNMVAGGSRPTWNVVDLSTSVRKFLFLMAGHVETREDLERFEAAAMKFRVTGDGKAFVPISVVVEDEQQWYTAVLALSVQQATWMEKHLWTKGRLVLYVDGEQREELLRGEVETFSQALMTADVRHEAEARRTKMMKRTSPFWGAPSEALVTRWFSGMPSVYEDTGVLLGSRMQEPVEGEAGTQGRQEPAPVRQESAQDGREAAASGVLASSAGREESDPQEVLQEIIRRAHRAQEEARSAQDEARRAQEEVRAAKEEARRIREQVLSQQDAEEDEHTEEEIQPKRARTLSVIPAPEGAGQALRLEDLAAFMRPQASAGRTHEDWLEEQKARDAYTELMGAPQLQSIVFEDLHQINTQMVMDENYPRPALPALAGACVYTTGKTFMNVVRALLTHLAYSKAVVERAMAHLNTCSTPQRLIAAMNAAGGGLLAGWVKADLNWRVTPMAEGEWPASYFKRVFSTRLRDQLSAAALENLSRVPEDRTLGLQAHEEEFQRRVELVTSVSRKFLVLKYVDSLATEDDKRICRAYIQEQESKMRVYTWTEVAAHHRASVDDVRRNPLVRQVEVRALSLSKAPAAVAGTPKREASAAQGAGAERFKEYRCYNCQQLGHIAKDCKNAPVEGKKPRGREAMLRKMSLADVMDMMHSFRAAAGGGARD